MKNPKKLILSGIILFLFSANLFAQAPDTLWTKTYGGTLEDACESVQQTSDGGYILVGETRSFSSGIWNDVWLIKTDSLGDTLWTKTYGEGGMSNQVGMSVQQTSDSGYIIAGYKGGGLADMYLIKTDWLGDTLWTRTYGGGITEDYAFSVQQTTDGGYIVVGGTEPYQGGVYLIKTDSLGDTLWTRTYGGGYWEYGSSIQLTLDGGYIIAGGTQSFGAGDWDVYLIKIDSVGDTLWTKTYGGAEYDRGWAVQLTSDSGYIVAGHTKSFGAGQFDAYLIKTDVDGDTLWTKTYGGTDFDYAWSAQETSGGRYIIAGETQSFGPGSRDVWLIKTDSNGDSLWARIYGGTEYDIGYSVQLTDDGGYIIGGKTASFGAGLTDAWLLKIEPDVSIKEEKISKNNLCSSNIIVFPNPFKNILNIEGCSEVKVYDITGKFVSEIKDQWDGKNNKGEEVKAGIYFIKAKGFSTKKIVMCEKLDR